MPLLAHDTVAMSSPPPVFKPPSLSALWHVSGGRTIWEQGVPPSLRPLVRAYVLGYTFCVAPRLVTLLIQRLSRRRPRGDGEARKHQIYYLQAVQRILCHSLEWQRFPTFCAALVGGSTLLEVCTTLTDCLLIVSFKPRANSKMS